MKNTNTVLSSHLTVMLDDLNNVLEDVRILTELLEDLRSDSIPDD